MPQPPNTFLENLIRFLLPYFLGTTTDIDAARGEIIETLNAYGARTRRELLIAARIIAFSMASLDTLMEAKTADLSPALKLRYNASANNLNRSTIQNEQTLDRSLAQEPPPQPEPPVNDIADAEVQDAINHAQAMLTAHRATRSPSPPDRNKQLWAGAMVETLRHMGYGPASPNGPATPG